jgi:small subunit ribosomal protein S21
MTNIVDCKDVAKNYGSDSGVGVTRRSGEHVESLLKRFKSKVKNSEILTEYTDRRYFTKPSVKKRQKKIKAIIEQQKKANEEKRFLKY